MKRAVPFIVSLALFMESVDTTVINTAIPAMSRSLHVNPIDLKIALISYLLTLAIFIPISGWMADKFGIKRVFTAALFIFTASSLWCGFAHNLPELIIARSIQGTGGALALPVGRLIIIRTFKRQEFITVMNRVVIVGALGMMLGPMLGGMITHYFSWRWIFWVNVPIGVLAIIMTQYFLPSASPQTVPPLDKLGFLLFGGGLAGLTFGFSAISETTMSGNLAFFTIIIAVGLLMGYLWHSHYQKYPIVKTSLLKYHTFQISTLSNLLLRLSFGSIPFLIPLLLQIEFGYPPQLSGILLAPIAGGILLAKPLILPLLRYLGYKKLLMLNTFLMALSIWTFIQIDRNSSIYFIGVLTFIFGFLISLQSTGMNSLAYSEISANDLSAATSIISTIQQLAQSFGVATSALFIYYFSSITSEGLLLTIKSFHYTFLMMGAITLLASLVFIRLKPTDGLEMLALASVTEHKL